MLSIDDLKPPLSGWDQIDTSTSKRLWENSVGDRMSLHFFDIPPDLTPTIDDIDAQRVASRARLEGRAGIVQIDAVVVERQKALQSIFKFPQQPTGMTYLASITIPFRDCSFVLKWQCEERGVTGMRDTIVFASVQPAIDERTGEITGWAQDPYDPACRDPVLRNASDDARWDIQFPDHPLSRARSYLRTAEQIRLSPRASAEPRFQAR